MRLDIVRIFKPKITLWHFNNFFIGLDKKSI